jgi:uncharacterized protein YlzI (FlbEa/FlbD family)
MQNNNQFSILPQGLTYSFQVQNNPSLTITSMNGKEVMEIDYDGNVYFLLDGQFKKIECENDISLMFVSVISGITGVSFRDRNELISKIIKNYRENQIDNILK